MQREPHYPCPFCLSSSQLFFLRLGTYYSNCPISSPVDKAIALKSPPIKQCHICAQPVLRFIDKMEHLEWWRVNRYSIHPYSAQFNKYFLHTHFHPSNQPFTYSLNIYPKHSAASVVAAPSP